MPSSNTITAFYDFVAGTKARSSQVNNNFDVLRGHRLPMSTDTATASDSTHNLGSDGHRWLNGFIDSLNMSGATSTTDFKIVPSTANTLGSVDLMFGATTITTLTPGGFSGKSIRPRPFTASSSDPSEGGVFRSLFATVGTTGGAQTITAGRITLNGNGVFRVGFYNPISGSPSSKRLWRAQGKGTSHYVMLKTGSTTTSMTISTYLNLDGTDTTTASRTWPLTSLEFNVFGLANGETVFEIASTSTAGGTVGLINVNQTCGVYAYEI